MRQGQRPRPSLLTTSFTVRLWPALLLLCGLSASCARSDESSERADPSSRADSPGSDPAKPSSSTKGRPVDLPLKGDASVRDAGSTSKARVDAAPPPLLPVDAPPPTSDWSGPFLTVTYTSAGIYSQPSLHRPLWA